MSVNVGSVRGGIQTYAGGAVYSATKYAVRAINRRAALTTSSGKGSASPMWSRGWPSPTLSDGPLNGAR